MATKFYCDACREEYPGGELIEITVNPRREDTHIIPCYFDVCHKCGMKLLKPIKEMRCKINVEYTKLEENNG